MQDTLTGFRQYMDSATQMALTTRKRYAREVGDFIRTVGAESLEDITPQSLLAWYQALHDKGLQQGTMVQKIAALKQFLRYLDEFMEDEHAGKLLKVLNRIKVPADTAPKRQTHVLRPDEVDTLLEYAVRRPGTGKRDRAIIHFLWATGCRRNEVVTLAVPDLNMVRRQASVLGKGSKPRVVYFDQDCKLDLFTWTVDRRRWGPKCDKVFISARGRAMAPDTLGAIVADVAKQAGIEDVWTHLFRHTRITELLNNGLSLQEVASFAGHSRVTTTMGYYHQDADRLKERYDQVMDSEGEEESVLDLFFPTKRS